MEILFWTSVVLSLYSYVLFPISLLIMSRIVRRTWARADVRPGITLVVSVYNEERVVSSKIENALTLDYPADKLEILVVSDGSTDNTENIVRSFRDKRVVLKSFRERTGKTMCLNRVIPGARGDIILFSDANSMYPPDILGKLARNFADPEIGLVTGWTRYGEIGQSEHTAGIYSRFEKWTKLQESHISSCVGADGAVFAIRKELYRTMRADDINDFVIPLDVIRQGKRVVLDTEVYCFEKSANEPGKEYQRQVRITNRTLNALRRNLEFLNPVVYGSFAYFVFSHKLMRFLVPFFLLGTFVTNLCLLNTSHFYGFTLGCQLAALAMAVSGMVGLAHGKLTDVAKYFLVMILAQATAWFRSLAGISDTIWTPQR